MSEADHEAIAELITRKLIGEQRARWVDPDTHEQHHFWVGSKIQDEADIRKMRKRIIESTLMWALPLALTFVAVAVWRYLQAQLTGQ